MLIIGITGTSGAGKGTIVDYLVKEKKFTHYSVSGYLKEELSKQGRAADRTNLQDIGNEIRTKYGPSYITQVLFEKAQKENKNSIIESIRNPKEAEFIKAKGGFVLAVVADQRTRYERIQNRSSEKDNVTFEQFQKQEEREMNTTDQNVQNLGKCIEMSDFVFNNDSSLENLYGQIEKVISKVS